METKKGTLRVTKYVKNIQCNNEKPYTFNIDMDFSFNGKECSFELDDNEVIKITIENDIFELKKVCKDKHKFKIPKDSCIAIEKFSIENFHLKLNRFSKFNIKDGYKLQNQNINEKFFYKDWSFYNEQIKNYYKDIKKLNLKFSDSIELKTDYRLVIGAEESIYETSIRLHHIYGIPFIPSSAIKGVVRSYMIYKYFEKELNGYKDKYNKFEEEVLFKDDDFKNYFGTPNEEGKIIFFDAFPIEKPTIKVDIINPMEEDKIINFLTVEETEFKFFIASKEKIDDSFITLFKKALQNHGIGGKTAVGYGYLKEIKK